MSLEAVNEFSYLDAQAHGLGVKAHAPMSRVAVTVSSGRTVSALAYTDQSPVVTLLHGAGLNAHTWDATLISMGLPALALDLPGHGDSSWREDAAYTPANLADDVIEALEALVSSPQILVGHSLGGHTAAAVAAKRPDLVDRLVLVDIVPGIDPAVGPAQLRAFYSRLVFDSRDELVDYAMSFGLGSDREGTARGVFFNTRVLEDGTVQWKHHFAQLASQILPDAETDGSVVDNGAAWRDLEAVRAPITLVRGATGYINPEALDQFASRIPAADLITVDAGHNVQETLPAELGRIIMTSRGDA